MNILGIFLAVATLLPVAVGCWNHFPTQPESRLAETCSQFHRTTANNTVELKVLSAQLTEATARMRFAFQEYLTNHSGDYLKYRTEGGLISAAITPLKAQQSALIETEAAADEELNTMRHHREVLENICLWVATPLAIFTALAFLLAKLSPPLNSKTNMV